VVTNLSRPSQSCARRGCRVSGWHSPPGPGSDIGISLALRTWRHTTISPIRATPGLVALRSTFVSECCAGLPILIWSYISSLTCGSSLTYPQIQGDESARTRRYHGIDVHEFRHFRAVSLLVRLFLTVFLFLSFVITDLDNVRSSDLEDTSRYYRWEASAASRLRLI